MGLTHQEARAFQRLITGLSVGFEQGAFYRFMTLTTAKNVTKNISKSFDLLKKRIERATYAKDKFHGFKFNSYFKMRTAEGNGVLHIVYWGRYIPQEWLSQQWQQIHGSRIVDIRAAYGCKEQRKNLSGLVGYLLTNYLVNKQPIIRFSYGWKWAWLGMCKSWKSLKGWLIRKNRIDNIKGVVPFSFKYRNIGLEYYKQLTKTPPDSTRQRYWTNPDKTKFSTWVHKMPLKEPLQPIKTDKYDKFRIAICIYLKNHYLSIKQ